ncbi:MAG: hypothetical protein JEY94_05580 [Melioribacteraceae bacterium]|nr:hypothetical protein [Melioribacteraceae bacterium]
MRLQIVKYHFLIFLLIMLTSFSKGEEVKFERVSVDKGLSHSSVFAIHQDSKGFLWFGTQNGLNKYDGYEFKIYRNDPDYLGSISHNTIFSITEIKSGEILIGTLGGGLNIFNPVTESFTHFVNDENNPMSISNNNVRCIMEDSEGTIWVGTDNGLNVFNLAEKNFTQFLHNPSDSSSISDNNIWSIYEDSKNTMWIGTYNGLNKIVSKNPFCFKQYNSTNNKNSLSHNYIWAICEDADNNLWVGSDNGLNIYNRNNDNFTRFFNNNNPNSLSHNKVWSFLKDENQDLWIGTLGGGLNKLVNHKDKSFSFQNFKSDLNNPNSLSHNYVWSLFQDRSGVLWIGTDVGLSKYDRTKFKFNLLKHIPNNENSLSNNEVTSIFKDSFNNLWIGTRDGLNKSTSHVNSFIHFNSSNKRHAISNNFIRTIYEAPSQKGILWIGTNGGLNKLDIKTNRLEVYSESSTDSNSLSSNNVTCILEDSEENLWIGSLGGINLLDRKTNSITKFLLDIKNNNSLSNNYVFSIVEDSSGYLWIGTSNGLNKFDRDNKKFTRYFVDRNNSNSLLNNFISDLYVDKENNLWIGTNGGLSKLNLSSNEFNNYFGKDGLPSNAVVGIEEDENNHLWLSTNNGISKFDKTNLSFENFSIGDGIQSNQFTGGASYKSENRQMFFGGINGLNSFYPSDVIKNTIIPPVVITDFLVQNKSIKLGDNSPLHKSISLTKEIKLSYEQNYFSFIFAALHFSSPQENKYKYKLIGIDGNWIESGGRRFANYTNIDPGEYVFKVIASNNDGVWNNEGSSIRIIITPPFWKTWWFILLSLTSIIGLTFTFVHYRTKNLLAIERLRIEIAEDLHDDIGTRLTEISMLSDMVYHTKSSCDDPTKKTIKSIGGIARQLIDNMSDIVWLINPKRDSLYELFLKLKDTYEDMLSHSNIYLYINDFEFLSGIRLPMEYRKHVYLLFKEALNNSIKHSKCSEISINTHLKSRILEITLYDNGNGFDLDKKSSGNGLQNMYHRSEIINGELRISSSETSGTMVQFRGRI